MATTETMPTPTDQTRAVNEAPKQQEKYAPVTAHKTVRLLLALAVTGQLIAAAIVVAYLQRTIPFMYQPDREFYSYFPPNRISKPFYSRPAGWNQTPAIVSVVAGSICLAMSAFPGFLLVMVRAASPVTRTKKRQMVPLAIWVLLASISCGVALAALIITARAFNASNVLRFYTSEQDRIGLTPWPNGYWLPEVWYRQLATYPGRYVYVNRTLLQRQASDSKTWRVTLIPLFIFSLLAALLGLAELLLAKSEVPRRQGPIDEKAETIEAESHSSGSQ